ncbi:hypothetical protein ABZT23_00645 [Streptomyces sp. NPDC005386]|uniref:hypothetical protein n=1 Tax=Streptomyces sp. NPDC005386 TaxID=3154562 RepID=UPI0033B2FAE6
MQTPEQQWAARQSERSASASPSPAGPVSNADWRQMTAYEQAAHLSRLDGDDAEARNWERMGKRAAAADAKPKKRGWFR